jgi:hypothetical protein
MATTTPKKSQTNSFPDYYIPYKYGCVVSPRCVFGNHNNTPSVIRIKRNLTDQMVTKRERKENKSEKSSTAVLGHLTGFFAMGPPPLNSQIDWATILGKW